MIISKKRCVPLWNLKVLLIKKKNIICVSCFCIYHDQMRKDQEGESKKKVVNLMLGAVYTTGSHNSLKQVVFHRNGGTTLLVRHKLYTSHKLYQGADFKLA